jgi:uncharacterized membrane protein
MERITRTAFIDAPPAKIFGYLMNARNVPEVWPRMVAVSNIKSRPDGTSESNDFTYRMAGVEVHGHTEFGDVARDRRIVWKSVGGIMSTTRWTLAPQGNGTAIIDEVEYQMPSNLLLRLGAHLLRQFNEREVVVCMENLKTRMETR